ncbi:MAG: hypothetical protein M0022_01950 [Desulfobacteraceae bacterium]|nr:hypothetical protein [Desulfobacteraceae bacterium]
MKVDPEDIAKLAVGPRKIKGLIKDATFSTWEALLSDIIVGDSFGVDRIDYLLRDSHHAGVMYGKFDHYRLIDTLRILPKDKESNEPTLGIEDGGIHSAEALLLARYFMFTQVYLHPVRRIYDIHLKDFLANHLPGSKFSADLATFLNTTDNNIINDLVTAAHTADGAASDAAIRIVNRTHFKVLYEKNPEDLLIFLDPGKVIYEAAIIEFGAESVRRDSYSKGAGAKEFPVRKKDGRIISSLSASEALEKIPDATIDFIFIDPAKREKAIKWLKEKRLTILRKAKEVVEEE